MAFRAPLRRVRPSLLAAALRLGLLSGQLAICACAGGSELACKKDPITGSDQCYGTSNSGGEAAVAAGVAAASWAVVGCTVNGCVGPYRCNEKTKMCEPIACSENNACPPAYNCNLTRGRCE